MNTDNIIKFEEKNNKTLSINDIITPEEYSNLIAKENLAPDEAMKKDIYERFIQDQNELDEVGLAPVSSEKIASEHTQNVMSLMEKTEKTTHEEKVLNEWKERLEKPAENVVEGDFTRTRKKAGYIDVVVLLVVILNIGFIVAMALLKK
ncbi:MAG: hypothetical protein HFJ02_06850 [Bacilli bacterium]|nr:hypothetical protein [Bacilli bacterium]